MFRVNFYFAIFLVVFLISCQDEKVPKGVLEKEEMTNAIMDMQLTDAYLNKLYDADTIKKQALKRYAYIFAKYKTDSAGFARSLKYYSKQPIKLQAMMDDVIKQLESFKNQEMQKDSLKNIANRKRDSINRVKMMKKSMPKPKL